MANNRSHHRLPISVKVKITHPDIGEKIVTTKNMSDNGLFVLTEPAMMPGIGEIVEGQIQGVVADAPVVRMRIVRSEPDGLALCFCDE